MYGKYNLPSIFPEIPANSFALATSFFLKKYFFSSVELAIVKIISSWTVSTVTLPLNGALIFGSTNNNPAFLLFATMIFPSVVTYFLIL